MTMKLPCCNGAGENVLPVAVQLVCQKCLRHLGTWCLDGVERHPVYGNRWPPQGFMSGMRGGDGSCQAEGVTYWHTGLSRPRASVPK